ncbi:MULTISPECIES: hypothetical protein [Morganella]|uniref:hypothetical protein n=1 Tax=Morganella TaxID=581 RepID=UPI0014045612|nr:MULTISPECIES: hypothetical protein [Morganella]MBS9569146.1 hypothetical protein [Morganella morganii subsp. morganii]QIM76766.1 hypothetical protein F3L16_12215 [Morganella morganii subsp. morganii]
MNKLTPLLNDISIILGNSDRPEFTLLQRYETATNAQKGDIVVAMIGRLIEQHQMLKVMHHKHITKE